VVAGLTATHSFGELLDIVTFDRGGAPLHFLLGHVALLADPSPDALRWLSVVFAVATVPLCFDIGRRLGGTTAGIVAAIVVGTSSMLAVYGTVGRMYALFAFVSALAVDLFLVALERRTPRSAYAAAAAAWLLPAAHPYGIIVAAIMALVALLVWRGRPLRPALPVLALAVAMTPFVVADLRLSERFGVGASSGESVAPPDFAARQLGEALAAFAGGTGVLALLFFGLALAGLFTVSRSRPAFALFALLALAAVPVLMVLAKTENAIVHQLSPRHLMFALPVWAALVGAGVARLVRDAPRGAPVVAVVAVAAVAVAAALAPAGIADPRTDPSASRAALAGPAAWVGQRMEDDAVLLFYSPVFLEAIEDTRRGTAIPRSGKPLRMLERASYPVPGIVGTVRLAGTTVRKARLDRRLGFRSSVEVYPGWLVYSVPGPFADPREVLYAARHAIETVRTSATGRTLPFQRDIRGGLVTVCGALVELGDACPEMP
jgi:4-amino-4-deoxy-L-arabinose transferase-like glycosyltransferase